MSTRVFAINPGSTSTKIALFEDESCLFSKNVAHDASELAKYADMPAQLPYRRDMILQLLRENDISLEGVDVFVGRGGGLVNIEGGVYAIDELVLEHARTCANGVVHPATLGPQLADEFARRFGAKAMVVNPPDTDEFQDLARMTGLKGVYRISHLHALNLKETAIRHSREVLGKLSKVRVFRINGGDRKEILSTAPRNTRFAKHYEEYLSGALAEKLDWSIFEKPLPVFDTGSGTQCLIRMIGQAG